MWAGPTLDFVVATISASPTGGGNALLNAAVKCCTVPY